MNVSFGNSHGRPCIYRRSRCRSRRRQRQRLRSEDRLGLLLVVTSAGSTPWRHVGWLGTRADRQHNPTQEHRSLCIGTSSIRSHRGRSSTVRGQSASTIRVCVTLWCARSYGGPAPRRRAVDDLDSKAGRSVTRPRAGALQRQRAAGTATLDVVERAGGSPALGLSDGSSRWSHGLSSGPAGPRRSAPAAAAARRGRAGAGAGLAADFPTGWTAPWSAASRRGCQREGPAAVGDSERGEAAPAFVLATADRMMQVLRRPGPAASRVVRPLDGDAVPDRLAAAP